MLKRVIFGLSDRMGLNAVVRRVTTSKHRLLTLCYHSVLPDDAIGTAHIYRNTVGVEELRQQLDILSSWFTFATPDTVLQAIEGKPIERPSVLITFDDGHQNLLQHAAPLLEQMGVPAIMHVTTGHIGNDDPLWTEELTWIVAGWQAQQIPLPLPDQSLPVPLKRTERDQLTRCLSALCKALPAAQRTSYMARLKEAGATNPPTEQRDAFRFLDWGGVRELHRRGFVIGSHTAEHSVLTRVADEDLDRELTVSKRQLEAETGSECPWIAYPNGSRRDVSQEVFERAKAVGYRAGFTSFGGFGEPSQEPLAIGRITIPGRLPVGVFRAMASGVHGWLSRMRSMTAR